MPLAPGTRLGPYEVVARLSVGGMGEIYRAKDPRLNREIAIKILPQNLPADSESRVLLEHEAKAIAALSHPNILVIYDFGEDRGITFVATELLEGETLRKRLARTAITWRRAAEIGAAVAEGLAAAHAKGIVHLDLKPENIFLTVDGRVKILDFGIARWLTSDPAENRALAASVSGSAVANSQVSAAGERSSTIVRASPEEPFDDSSSLPTVRPGGEIDTVLGTPPYMSPEQVLGHPVDPTSDIFSLGCMLYEMVTGRRIFARQSRLETMEAIANESPPDVSEWGKKCPQSFDRLIMRCLEKDPGRRTQSTRDLAFQLSTIATSRADFGFPGGISRRAVTFLAVVLFGIIAVSAFSYFYFHHHQPAAYVESVAVLPFACSSLQDSEYLCSEIEQSLVDSLSGITRLRIMANVTTSQYRSRKIDPRELGRNLDVNAVVMGQLIQHNQNIVVRAELIRTADGAQLWGRQYNISQQQFPLLEEEIARDISERLLGKLDAAEKKSLIGRVMDFPAYDAYIRGRYCLRRRTNDDLIKGISYFQQAVDRQPSYALAYSGLADSYSYLSSQGELPSEDAMPRAKAAANMALAIDDNLAEAHASNAEIKAIYEWDWEGAEREYQRALQLSSNSATIRESYAAYLASVNRLTESLAEIQRAQQLDPLSLSALTTEGWIMILAHQYDGAAEILKTVVELNPNSPDAFRFLGLVYELKGMHEEAISELLKASSHDSETLALLGYVYGVSGKSADADAVFKRLSIGGRRKYVSQYSLALVYLGGGKKDQAIQCLRQAYKVHDTLLTFIRVDPTLDPLRSDPKFQDLVRQVNHNPSASDSNEKTATLSVQ